MARKGRGRAPGIMWSGNVISSALSAVVCIDNITITCYVPNSARFREKALGTVPGFYLIRWRDAHDCRWLASPGLDQVADQ